MKVKNLGLQITNRDGRKRNFYALFVLSMENTKMKSKNFARVFAAQNTFTSLKFL